MLDPQSQDPYPNANGYTQDTKRAMDLPPVTSEAGYWFAPADPPSYYTENEENLQFLTIDNGPTNQPSHTTGQVLDEDTAVHTGSFLNYDGEFLSKISPK
jgi:hypothetical protein